MILIRNNSLSASFNLACEEYLLNKFTESIFMVWSSEPSILIGKNQNTYSEINLEYVKSKRIPVVRRMSGGGTVFCDTGNLNFTFLDPNTSYFTAFDNYTKPIIEYLKTLGVNAEFSGRNDITIENKKVSGNAQYKQNGKVLHHGTLLFTSFLPELVLALKPSLLKLESKGIQSVQNRVTNIQNYLTHQEMTVLEFKKGLYEYIENNYEAIRYYELDDQDIDAITEIQKSKYDLWEWNYGQSPKFQYTVHHQFEGGIIEIQLTIRKGYIQKINFFGDFFGELPIEALEKHLENCCILKEDINQKLESIPLQKYVVGMTKDILLHLISGILEGNSANTQPGEMLPKRKPDWLKVKLNRNKQWNQVNTILSALNLSTVCEGANCPNRMECYGKNTATFMILGRECTRHCRFCNIGAGLLKPIDYDEPNRVARAVAQMQLAYCVITSVTRDDLSDGGAAIFVQTIQEIKNKMGNSCKIEVLIPDLKGNTDALRAIIEAGPSVINHNIETISRLYEDIRPEAIYERSLQVLRDVKKLSENILTKTGMMVGLGETENEIFQLIDDLALCQVDIITIGQYLAPSHSHYPVYEYVHPDIFEKYKKYALSKGIEAVASGPLVRSSYHAIQLFDTIT